jgi:hypothetical protein
VKHKKAVGKKAVSREPRAYERVRKICMTYPEAAEKNSWGHPNFRAGKKTFVTGDASGRREYATFAEIQRPQAIGATETPREVTGLGEAAARGHIHYCDGITTRI